ncbi:MAG: 3-dehydroquinate synthase [Clostridiales bacterium]|nr:3-dehydroquinate synthase [Clostridiales bacterium]
MSNITFEKFNLDKYSDCVVVTDDKIASLYNIAGDNVYLLPQGEAAKSFEHVRALCSWLLSRNVGSCDKVVAIGGGSIGDTVGFTASIYKRGVQLLHVPTTLLAQIDSSIGGKTAIDLDGIKNAVGTFYEADTLIDVDFLKTLDSEQLVSGQGEVLKYRMLSSDVDSVYNYGKGNLSDVIKACVLYKQAICDTDPFDKSIRSMLNFGHTVGHALELSYGIPHGVAVANGIYYETLLASQLNVCFSEYADKWMKVVTSGFPIYPLAKSVLPLMLNDKKNTNGKVCFVLPGSFGKVYLSLDEVEELLLND